MRKKMKVESIGPKNIAFWFDDRDNIDMTPVYQRTGTAWSYEDKAFLIDSIINGFDVPKFYFADFTGFANELNEAKKEYAVIDGKQRLTAIFEFMENKFPLLNNTIYMDDPEIKISGMYYTDLQKYHSKIVRKFENFLLTTMGVQTNDINNVIELFQRLNRGKPLTTTELRNASDSVSAALIRSISEHIFFSKNISFPKNRMQHTNASAKLLLLEIHGVPVDVKKKNLDLLYRDEFNDLEDTNMAFERIISHLDRMSLVFKENDPLLRTEGMIPVYYWLFRQEQDILPGDRDYILKFMKKLNSKGDVPSDKSIQEFRVHNRNTNDKGSIEGRYKILSQVIKIERLNTGLRRYIGKKQ